jgi:hypothetical protein
MFRFALVDADNAESLVVAAFARPDFKHADVSPQGEGRSLRVVQSSSQRTHYRARRRYA